ncbi:MAG: alpha/beta hydrolase [Acidobacteria bacterium]|nr:alpha/beta hydrolase [Acidobacteriota bacterium]
MRSIWCRFGQENGGRGTPAILLHGFPHTRRIWAPIMSELAATHQAIAPDFRGFGGSSRTGAGYDASTRPLRQLSFFSPSSTASLSGGVDGGERWVGSRAHGLRGPLAY